MTTTPTDNPDLAPDEKKSLDFVRQIVTDDLASGKRKNVVTRFPPEPNGYLHIGHAKSISVNFGIAADFGGTCHLRFDDTNPTREEDAYVRAIKEDIRWLGYDWGEHEYYASDYYQQLYDWAVKLIQKGKAFVCDLDAEQIRQHRGTLVAPGKESPSRDRSVEENLDLFTRMKNGEFADGTRTLRAKIDMASPNLNMRDPVLYRILKATHHRTGDDWCIYPMYDFAHGQSDSIEGITHSICTLEFEDHRPLYDWLINELEIHHPQQIEFARLNINYAITSKRKLLQLVEEKLVTGWDDPRMPTLSGMRRRGYPPAAIRTFCQATGITKRENLIEVQMLEHAVREELNRTSPRVMGVLNPLKVVIENYPEGQVDELEAVNNPQAETSDTRTVPFSRELYIERDDFREEAPRKYRRLKPGQEVRLRWAYLITCTDFVKDEATGEIVEVRCTYDPETRGGDAPDGRKVKGTIHWVSAPHALPAEVRLYDRLFKTERPGDVPEGGNWMDNLNPDSLTVLTGCRVEPSLADAVPGSRVQFERNGYFCVDSKDAKPGKLVFNRIVSLRDSWAKMEQSGKQRQGSAP